MGQLLPTSLLAIMLFFIVGIRLNVALQVITIKRLERDSLMKDGGQYRGVQGNWKLVLYEKADECRNAWCPLRICEPK